MSTIPSDLEQYKLSTEFGQGYWKHTITSTGESAARTEKWSRCKALGNGTVGTVWLEREERGTLRAVKQMPKTNTNILNSSTELKALAYSRAVRLSLGL